MAGTGGVSLALAFELSQRVLPDRFQHPVPVLSGLVHPMPDQTLVEQRLEVIDVGSGDCFRRGQRAAAREDGEPGVPAARRHRGARRTTRSSPRAYAAAPRCRGCEKPGARAVRSAARGLQSWRAPGRERLRARSRAEADRLRHRSRPRARSGSKARPNGRGAFDEERVSVADRHRRDLVDPLGLKAKTLTTDATTRTLGSRRRAGRRDRQHRQRRARSCRRRLAIASY